MNTALATRPSAIAAMAERYAVSEAALADTIKKTCIQANGGREATDAEFRAFVIVANQYQLNPLTREIYAFADPRKGIIPIVGVDGWSRVVNREETFDGMEFSDVTGTDGKDIGIECSIWIKGRSRPIKVTEWLSECKRNTGPWGSHPRRMLRHKAFMQAARLAFGLAGIFDEDDAREIRAGADAEPQAATPAARLDAILDKPTPPAAPARTAPTPEPPAADPDIIDAEPVTEPTAAQAESEPAGADEYDPAIDAGEGPDVSDATKFREAAQAAAKRGGYTDTQFGKRCAAWMKHLGAITWAQAVEKTNTAQRLKLIDLLTSKTLGPDGTEEPPQE